MDLRLSKMWQERVWSRECVIYCFQRWVCNAQITLSEDVIIQCGLLYNLTVSSTLTFVFWILFENPRFHSQSCAVPSVNLPVQWRDRRHEIMRALTNIFQLERDVYFVFFCATQIPVMNLLSTKQIQSVIGQHLTTSCFFFHFSKPTFSQSQSISTEGKPNEQMTIVQFRAVSSCRCVRHRWLSPVEVTCCQKSLKVHMKRNGSEENLDYNHLLVRRTISSGAERINSLVPCDLCGAFKCMFLDEVMQQSTFNLRHS